MVSSVCCPHLSDHHRCSRVVIGTVQGKAPPPATIARAVEAIHVSLRLFETYWLRDSPFIQGFTKPTVADLNACQEILQVTPFLPADTLSAYPRVRQWLAELAKLPHWDDVQRPYMTRLVPALRKRIAEKTADQQSKL